MLNAIPALVTKDARRLAYEHCEANVEDLWHSLDGEVPKADLRSRLPCFLAALRGLGPPGPRSFIGSLQVREDSLRVQVTECKVSMQHQTYASWHRVLGTLGRCRNWDVAQAVKHTGSP